MVSVIIPTFNCAGWIERAIRSVLDEGQADVEIIVVDDGSKDDTAEVLASWINSGAVKYVYQENRGLPGARNAGAQVARGEYLAFLDADDALAPGAIRRMQEAMQGSEASWCLVDIVRVSERGSEIQRTVVPEGDLFYAVLEYNFIRRGMFFRAKDFFDAGMYDESIRMCEDWELNIRMFERRRRFVYVAEPLYLYTKREGSITTGHIAENLAYTEKVFRKHLKRLADRGDRRARQIYAAQMWDTGRKYRYSVHMTRAAVGSAMESLRYDFSLARLLHPIAYLLSRIFQQAQSGVAKQTQ
jgi:glycosyltransferase involved in cell wall biosynthesis